MKIIIIIIIIINSDIIIDYHDIPRHALELRHLTCFNGVSKPGFNQRRWLQRWCVRSVFGGKCLESHRDILRFAPAPSETNDTR